MRQFRNRIILDDSDLNSDWIKMDPVELELDTKEKLMAFLEKRHWRLENFKKTDAFKKAMKMYIHTSKTYETPL
jgi:hypothetical protein